MAEERVSGGLDDLRGRIDLLDEHLVRLLNARAACALEIGRLKRQAGVDIYQPSRESEVLNHVEGVNTGPLDGPAIRRLFERIIDEARRLERIAEEAARSDLTPSSQGAPRDLTPRSQGAKRSHAKEPGR